MQRSVLNKSHCNCSLSNISLTIFLLFFGGITLKNDIDIELFIRNEMNRLDSVTGISTSDSPVYLTNSYNLVGTYSPFTYPDCFSFSRKFFSDEDINTETLLHIIRHEYAHCLNFRIYRQHGHGWWFKHCCKIIDCYPDKEIYVFLRKKTQSYIESDRICIQS